MKITLDNKLKKELKNHKNLNIRIEDYLTYQASIEIMKEIINNNYSFSVLNKIKDIVNEKLYENVIKGKYLDINNLIKYFNITIYKISEYLNNERGKISIDSKLYEDFLKETQFLIYKIYDLYINLHKLEEPRLAHLKHTIDKVAINEFINSMKNFLERLIVSDQDIGININGTLFEYSRKNSSISDIKRDIFGKLDKFLSK